MRREDVEMDKALLRNIPKVDELLAPTRALCPDASAAAVTAVSSALPPDAPDVWAGSTV